MPLRLSRNLVLPDNFATEGVAVIGMRGSGKSNTEVRWAEVLYKARIPFVAVDPKGDWWGLRSSADGKAAGLSVPVFGGLHGDFLLEERLGGRIADLLVDNNMSAVLDVSRLSHGARARFLTDFCRQLMDRHQVEPHVRCVILEEAHRYIPQNVTGPVAALKEAAAAILLEGRAFGLGCWAATQRPARLHKDVLEEVGSVVVHRIGAAATNDLRTVAGWVKHEDLGGEIVSTLTKLTDGEAWVLAPSTLGIAQRVQIDRRQTFDSASTPLVGAGSRPTVTLADIDAAAIKEALSDAIEKAKEADPAELKRRLAKAEAALAQADKWRERAERLQSELDASVVEVIEVPVLEEALVLRVEEALEPVVAVLAEVQDRLTWETNVVGDTIEMTRRLREDHGRQDVPRTGPARGGARAVADRPGPERAAQRPDPPARREPSRPPVPRTEAAEGIVNEPRQKILDGLAWYESVGVAPVNRSHLAFVAGTSPNSSGYEKNLGALRGAGLVDYPAGGLVALTEAGRELSALSAEITTTGELLSVLERRLGAPKGRILRALVHIFPEDTSREELAATIGISAQSSGFEKNLGSLRTLGLIDYPQPGRVVAREALFIGGA